MALDESALFELVVALRTRDGGVDLVRELAQWLANELIEAEATEVNRPGFCIRSSITLEGSGDASKEGVHA